MSRMRFIRTSGNPVTKTEIFELDEEDIKRIRDAKKTGSKQWAVDAEMFTPEFLAVIANVVAGEKVTL